MAKKYLKMKRNCYQRDKKIICRKEGDKGALLFNPLDYSINVLDPVGVMIWDLCNSKYTSDEMAKLVRKTFNDVPLQAIAQDVNNFLDDLLKKGYVKTV